MKTNVKKYGYDERDFVRHANMRCYMSSHPEKKCYLRVKVHFDFGDKTFLEEQLCYGEANHNSLADALEKKKRMMVSVLPRACHK